MYPSEWLRFKVLGPDGTGYPVVPDAQLAGSDGDEW